MFKRLFIVFALVAGDPSFAEALSDQVESIDQVLILKSPTVKVKKTADPNVAEITIKPITPHLIALAPIAFAHSTPVKEMTKEIWKALFESESIPAVLTWKEVHGDEQGVSLNLSLKQLNQRTGTFVFNVSKSDRAIEARSDQSIAKGTLITDGVLRNVTLSIDDQRGRVIRWDRTSSTSLDQVSHAVAHSTMYGCVIQPYTKCDIPKSMGILAGASLEGVNLAGATIKGLNLSGADLPGANLAGATIKGVNLSGANLMGANLSGATIKGVSLNGANLQGAIMVGAVVKGVKMRGSNLPFANLAGATLKGVNLSGANLLDANLAGATLKGVNLSGANLMWANLLDATLQGVNLNGADLQNAKGCSTTTPSLTYSC